MTILHKALIGVSSAAVVFGGVWYAVSQNKVDDKNATNEVVQNINTVNANTQNINTQNQNGNTNTVTANTNTANTNSSNANQNTNTSSYQTYTHPIAGYTLRFLTSWYRINEANGTIDTFAPTQNPPAGSCFLKISTNGLLGHETDLKKGPDQTIRVAGVTVKKHTWLAEDGSVAYYNFELQKSGKPIGFEGSVGNNVNNCSAVLDDIVSSFTLD